MRYDARANFHIDELLYCGGLNRGRALAEESLFRICSGKILANTAEYNRIKAAIQ